MKLNLSQTAIKVLEARYLKREGTKIIETPEQMFQRVAENIAEAEREYNGDYNYAVETFYNLMTSFNFLPNSPTLMNAGRTMGMLSACYALPFGDSIQEIFQTVLDIANIQKAGGGTGIHLDSLRPTGSYISSSGGTTSGPLSFWRVASEATNAIQQGSFRRGANMGMMSAVHPDITILLMQKNKRENFLIITSLLNWKILF